MLLEIFDDRVGDALAAKASAEIDEFLRAVVFALKHGLVKIRATLLEPFLGNFGVAESLQNPCAHFHVALLRGEPAVGFHRFHCLFLADTEKLVLRNDLDLYATLFVGAFDRLQDHVFSRRFGEDRDCLSLLDKPQRSAASSLAHRRASERHDVVDRFRRPDVRWKTRRGIFAFFLRASQTD